MSAPVIAFPAFHDLKMRNSKGGGFSDGGVVCISKSLSTTPVDIIAPIPGTALGGFSTPVGIPGELPIDQNASGLFMNFDPDNDVDVELSIVFADGSSWVLPDLVSVPKNTPAGVGVTPYPFLGIIITHPNKIRARLVAASGYSLPSRRVLCKAVLLEYDKPGDLS